MQYPNADLFVVCIFLYMDWMHIFSLSKYREKRARKNSVILHYPRLYESMGSLLCKLYFFWEKITLSLLPLIYSCFFSLYLKSSYCCLTCLAFQSWALLFRNASNIKNVKSSWSGSVLSLVTFFPENNDVLHIKSSWWTWTVCVPFLFQLFNVKLNRIIRLAFCSIISWH